MAGIGFCTSAIEAWNPKLCAVSQTSLLVREKFHVRHGESQLSSNKGVFLWRSKGWKLVKLQAVHMKPSDGSRDATEDFVRRMERTWLITKQPKPLPCASCGSSGKVDCQWCNGTGYFMLGDTMLCEVDSHDTSCRVCFGKGILPCDNCKGTGFRARWLGEPSKKKS